MDILKIALGIFGGAISGVAAAALGFAKSSGESIDNSKFLQTVVVGGVVGGVGGYLGMDYTTAYTYVGSIGGITLIEYVKKTVLRRVFPNSRVTKFLA